VILASFSVRYAEMITRVSADMLGELAATIAWSATPERGVLRRCFWPLEQPVSLAA